ncbi:MAG: hypothetical protein ACPGPE_01665 [Planctomycetota bacterium]
MRHLPALVAFFAISLGPTGAAPSAAGQDTEALEALMVEVNDLMLRLPLRYHIQAYESLARSREPEAIGELARRYEKPDLPKDQERYLMASSLAAIGKKGKDGLAQALADWREDANGAEDAWLWRHALAVEIRLIGPEGAIEAARASRNVALRGAAIEALSATSSEALYDLIPELLQSPPKKDQDQIALMGAYASALTALGNKKTQTETPWKKLALTLVATLEDENVPRAAKLILARHLAAELDAEAVVLEAAAWRTLLAKRAQEAKDRRKEGDKASPEADDADDEYVRPRFFGVEVTGERVCYLLDLSDSMAAPIPPEWKPKGAPESGPRVRKKRKKGDLPTEADIPWYIVKTRFDVAREHLRVSLERLQPDQKFCVIGFGSNAEYIKGTKGMVKATPGNVKKVLKELDGIKIGAPQGERVHGTIWGDTNLHAGLKLAFATSKKGRVKGAGYVDPETFVSGADTLFVLSDGDPSVDDYTVTDVDYGDGRVITDKESKREGKERTMKMNFIGPYSNWPLLLEDTRRMNMLRELEIHVISVGDADEQALGMLADIGLGKLQVFGRSQD